MTRYSFALLAYAFAAIMLGTTLPTPMYALYAERMHFAVLTTTVIFATYAVGVLFALLVFGRWSDAVGRRPVLLAGAACALLSAAVFLIAHSVPELLIGRFLSGLSAGIFTGTATAAVIEAAPESWRTRAAAVATVANIGGLGLGPLLAGLLVQYAPQPLHLAFALHIVIVVLAVAAILLAAETSQRNGGVGLQRLSIPPQTRSVFVVAATAAFAGFAVMGLFTAVAPSFVSGVIGITNHAVAGAIVASLFAASAVAQLLTRRMDPARAVAVGCCRPGRRHGDSGCFAAAFVAARADRRGSDRRVGPGHELRARPRRGGRTHPTGTPGGGEFDVLRRRLRRDLAAGDRRGPGGPALGSA